MMEEGYFLNLFQIEDTHALAAWETYKALGNLQDFGETIRIIKAVKSQTGTSSKPVEEKKPLPHSALMRAKEDDKQS